MNLERPAFAKGYRRAQQIEPKVQISNDYVPLPRSFYARDTHEVARDLLGKLLVRRWRGKVLAGRITEVECYVGEDDAACHASRGRTERTDVLYGDAGHAYVYFIYGMYDMLNVVTEHKEFPAAVLIRGVVPVLGIDGPTDGPGKLTRALHVTRAQNREDVTRSDALFVADDSFVVASEDITTTPRVGVEYAGADAKLPWRYVLRNPNDIIQNPNQIQSSKSKNRNNH